MRRNNNRIARAAALPPWRRSLDRLGLRLVRRVVHAVRGPGIGQRLIILLQQTAGSRRSAAFSAGRNAAGRVADGDKPILGIVTPEYVKIDVRIDGLVKMAESCGYIVPQYTTSSAIVSGADRTNYDAILVRRDGVNYPDAADFLAVIRATGTRLIVDFDDDMLSPENREMLLTNSNYTAQALDTLVELCAAADQVITSTEPLARLARGVTAAPVTVFQNLLDPQSWGPDAGDHGRVSDAAERTNQAGQRGSELRLLYFGTLGRSGDLDLIRELPALVSHATGRRTVVELLGITSGRVQRGFDSLVTSNYPYPEFVEFLRSQRGRWAVGLAPLQPSSYNDARSDLKLLEYAALGIPVVASRVGPYREAEELAVLVDNTPDAWNAAVLRLVTDPDYAQARVATAQDVVFGSRMVTAEAAKQWTALVLGRAVGLAVG